MTLKSCVLDFDFFFILRDLIYFYAFLMVNVFCHLNKMYWMLMAFM